MAFLRVQYVVQTFDQDLLDTFDQDFSGLYEELGIDPAPNEPEGDIELDKGLLDLDDVAGACPGDEDEITTLIVLHSLPDNPVHITMSYARFQQVLNKYRGPVLGEDGEPIR